MTKAQLQRRYEFLLLQLKIINELSEIKDKSDSEIFRDLGAIAFYSRAETLRESINFIEDYNEQYNFYHKLMNIDDYKF